MKLATHIASALLVSAIFVKLSPTSCQTYLTLLMYGIAVYLSQIGIDTFGHTWVSYRGIRFPKRNRLHSLPGIILWGFLFGLPFIISCPLYTIGLVVGMLIHWIEDMVTEGGVYIGKNRVKLPFRIRYDDPVANRVAILSFIVIFLILLFQDILNPSAVEPPASVYYLVALFYSVIAFFSV